MSKSHIAKNPQPLETRGEPAPLAAGWDNDDNVEPWSVATLRMRDNPNIAVPRGYSADSSRRCRRSRRRASSISTGSPSSPTSFTSWAPRSDSHRTVYRSTGVPSPRWRRSSS
jgi:hypothetical protein